MPDLPDLLRQQVQMRLLAWANAGLRDLPWRRQRDPYRVWVSEVMLQQTRVETVIPYYERWMARFPTIEALARADLQEVLKCWEGLGYYARGRNLHRSAQIVVAQYGGQLPHNPIDLVALPGIGPYTAGAILSIAFGQDAAALDGNIRRVLCRLFAIDADPRRPETRETLWALAGSLIPSGNAGLFNEGMMELGAMICRPRNPGCVRCPLSELCQGYASRSPESYPRRIHREPLPHYRVAAAVIWRDGRLLIAQRPLHGLLGGLWEFPGGKVEPGETLPECLKRELHEEMDIDIDVGRQLAVIRHAYTHFRVTVYAFQCEYRSVQDPKPIGVRDWHWVDLAELEQYAFPVVDQRIIAVLRNPWEQTVLAVEQKEKGG